MLTLSIFFFYFIHIKSNLFFPNHHLLGSPLSCFTGIFIFLRDTRESLLLILPHRNHRFFNLAFLLYWSIFLHPCSSLLSYHCFLFTYYYHFAYFLFSLFSLLLSCIASNILFASVSSDLKFLAQHQAWQGTRLHFKVSVSCRGIGGPLIPPNDAMKHKPL